MAQATVSETEDPYIRDHVAEFVKDHHLEHSRVLDVGAGTGKLQDAVANYTGLDISPTAARFYHKPFVVGTATAMPFKDGEFDAAWSIFVLEHIPNPEAALNEIRRVIKPGGFLYLLPAWDCAPWAAEGYEARPYSDFGVYGKLVKASIPIRELRLFKATYKAPIRLIRSFGHGPTRLHYRRLTPNYREYWQADSDAVNNLHSPEVMRWFTSRGDDILRFDGQAVEIRVRKGA
jgi:SAM-dependent methyltransferase